jgi:hypothetical protein
MLNEEEQIMVLREKNYTIYTLWCLFTAQNRTSHYFFPFTINWLIYHYSAPFCFKFAQIDERGLGISQYLALTNLSTF